MQKILDILKKQMLSVICGVVALVAVVALFWPTGGWFDQLSGYLNARAKVNTDLTALITQKRNAPNVTDGPQQPLTLFPTDELIKQGQTAVIAVHNQSTDMLDSAVRLNSHAPLLDGVLPNGSDIKRAEFIQRYKEAVDDDGRIRAWPPPGLTRGGRPIPPLKAGRKPNADQIQKALEDLKTDIDKETLVTSVVDNQVTRASIDLAKTRYDQQSRTKPLELAVAAAANCKVYVEAGAIKKPDAYTKLVTAVSNPSLNDIWAAQLNLWAQEDVATGVALANADASGVQDSAVKQIVDFTAKSPAYVVKDDPSTPKTDGTVPKAPEVSPTGRECNPMYDVIQFTVTLDADAARVPAVINALERGQFITVTNVKAEPKDTADFVLGQYFYGKNPVVRLTVECEELLLRDWIQPLQPPDAGPGKVAGLGGLGGP